MKTDHPILHLNAAPPIGQELRERFPLQPIRPRTKVLGAPTGFVKSPVVERRPLSETILVRVSVPSEPRKRDSEFVGRPYHECLFAVTHGKVLGFFYGLPEGAAPGTKVNAFVKIFERVQADGVRTVYANFDIAPDQESRPALDFVVHSNGGQFKETERTIFHYATPQADGVVEVRHFVPYVPKEMR